MKALLEKSGLSFDTGGISNAELCAYSKGLELLRDYIGEVENSIIISEADTDYLIRYADMLNIDMSRFGFEELVEELVRRFSLRFASSSYGEADALYLNVGSGEYAFTYSNSVIIGAALGDLKEAGKFLASYAPCCTQKLYSGEGELLTFDMRDGIGYTFNSYDALKLPFEFQDSLRSDIFEQY